MAALVSFRALRLNQGVSAYWYRWRIVELIQSLDVVGFPDCQLNDPDGNAKLRKRGGATCRDDVAAAIILSVAEGRRRALQPEPEEFSYAVL